MTDDGLVRDGNIFLKTPAVIRSTVRLQLTLIAVSSGISSRAGSVLVSSSCSDGPPGAGFSVMTYKRRADPHTLNNHSLYLATAINVYTSHAASVARSPEDNIKDQLRAYIKHYRFICLISMSIKHYSNYKCFPRLYINTYW